MSIKNQITTAVISAAVLTLGIQFVAPKAAATAGPMGQRKVRICHATDSHSNPYTINKVDKSSIDEVNNKYLNGHGDHEGPVWYEGIADHSWGDIIPPFTNDAGNSYPGQNWTATGRSIYENGCNLPKADEDVTTPTTPTTPNNGGGQGGGVVLAASTVKKQGILAETGTPVLVNALVGTAVLAAASYVTLRTRKLTANK